MRENNSRWQLVNGTLYDTLKCDWDEHLKTQMEPTVYDLLNMMDKLLQKHPRNLIKILDKLPEEEIQKYIRSKKLAKLKNKSQ